ncbi:hypothetical protein O6H91_23G048000 [Diphasiastrum complanatum]|uniref:Uncharacterized protein n=2 Tax=Diphasiastrum complanatum TaxID=34168 RepID=A0ACC2AAJ1_DIPCM|nr:hypothetical protein O6H91_23G047700 [Diphasiastrum complanatum]KAJ7514516.1 hypothetical protein O6H91_23G048000 [Diphasiastrum complanatum]
MKISIQAQGSRAVGNGVFNAAAISIFLISITWIWFWAYRRKHCSIVGPKAWPLFGSALEMIHNFDHLHDWLLVYFRKTKTINIAMPSSTYTYTVDPVLVEHILKTNFSNYPKGKGFYEKMEVLLGDGIFNSDDEIWKRQRKTASFEFSSKILRDFSTVVFRRHALRLGQIVAHSADTREPIEMQDLFSRLTLDSICKVGFGVELGVLASALPDNPFAKAFDNANVIVTMRFFDPFWKLKRLLNVGLEASLKKSAKEIDKFIYKVIHSRRSEIQASRACGKSDQLKPDLLSRFMELGEDPANQINDKSLRDIVLNFIIAGRDTTAVTLSWFIYMMALHPEIADKVYEELKQLERNLESEGSLKNSTVADQQSFNELLAKFADRLDYETLARLPYLHAALTETLRLYPAVPQDVKGIVTNDIAPDGTRLKGGDMVIYVPYCMGRMEFLWGKDAEQFKPERWLKDGTFQAISPFKFTAFQAGPRICLGKDSAYLQMKMTAALLCRFFMFELVPGHQVKYRMMTLLSMAHGIKVIVTKRT